MHPRFLPHATHRDRGNALRFGRPRGPASGPHARAAPEPRPDRLPRLLPAVRQRRRPAALARTAERQGRARGDFCLLRRHPRRRVWGGRADDPSSARFTFDRRGQGGGRIGDGRDPSRHISRGDLGPERVAPGGPTRPRSGHPRRYVIHAVIWYSDLRGSPALAESLPLEAYLATLDTYFDCIPDAVAGQGGEPPWSATAGGMTF